MSKNLRELEQLQQKLEYNSENLRVFIADVLPIEFRNEQDLKTRMSEVENLVNTYWWVVILSHVQKRWQPDYKSYIWSWKLDEIIQQMQEQNANLLILWNILKPIQIYNINEKLKSIWAKAWDRIDLILKNIWKKCKNYGIKTSNWTCNNKTYVTTYFLNVRWIMKSMKLMKQTFKMKMRNKYTNNEKTSSWKGNSYKERPGTI